MAEILTPYLRYKDKQLFYVNPWTRGVISRFPESCPAYKPLKKAKTAKMKIAAKCKRDAVGRRKRS